MTGFRSIDLRPLMLVTAQEGMVNNSQKFGIIPSSLPGFEPPFGLWIDFLSIGKSAFH